MKKLFVLGALALATLSMSAQDYTGKWFVGGTFGFKSESSNVMKANSDKWEKDNTFKIKPLVGYFIAPTLAVGGQIGYEGGKEYGAIEDLEGNATGTQKSTPSNFVIAPLVRKYIPIGDAGFNFFGQVSLPVQFGSTKYKNDATGAELDKVTTFNVNLEATVGFDYIINEKYSVETSMYLASIGMNSSKHKDVKRQSDFNADINPGKKLGDFEVGFKILF